MRAFPVGLLVHPCRGPVEHNRLNPLFGVLPLFAEIEHGSRFQQEEKIGRNGETGQRENAKAEDLLILFALAPLHPFPLLLIPFRPCPSSLFVLILFSHFPFSPLHLFPLFYWWLTADR